MRAKSLPADPELAPGSAPAAAAVVPTSPGAPSLLSKPSPALTSLVDSLDAADHVLEFVRMPVTVRDIRQAMQRDLQEVARRRLALLALDGLLRTVASTEALHDVLWCFASALARDQKAQMTEGIDAFFPRSAHVASGLASSGPIAESLRSSFHSLLHTVLIVLCGSVVF